ncbi:DUF4172 domain-containing protein [Hoeflea marina]|uniref:DUF4172 domain-containing protein n=1 Tax=Hoeflea marina TaxID=274592 RepID=UPI00130503DA|nr:DUF4172 domain-containing protein [Hoeflea marina]
MDHLDWPDFACDGAVIAPWRRGFSASQTLLSGIETRHLSTEAIKTSEIEGELLNRDSVQASIKYNPGLETPDRKGKPAEQGIAKMMTSRR